MRPIAISVTVLLTAAFPAAPAAGQGFGSTVAAGSREIFVSEPVTQFSPGTVYVYTRSGNAWRESARLSASDGVPQDRFGRSLSVDGDRLLIGATSLDSSRGAAYVFERDGSGAWKQSAKLLPATVVAGDAYGRQVLLKGDLAYVAAWGRNQSRGTITIFRRGANGRWTEEQSLVASDGQPNDFFGSSVAIDGDLMLVGAAQKDSSRGAVYVFHRDPAAGQWKEESKIVRPGTLRNTRFGTAVAFHNGRALIGMPGLDQSIGAVYVYARAGDRWVERMRLAPFDGLQFAQFGSIIQTMPGEVWIGAPGADAQGRIYRFAIGTDSSVTGVTKLSHTETARGDQFGGVFAVVGDAAVVGSPGDDHGAGTAVILARGSGTWATGKKVLSEEKTLAAIRGSKRDCTTGKVELFDCSQVDLLAYMPVKDIGGSRGVRLNDVWGWTDPTTDREYALVGRIDGTAFVDITDPVNPRYLGDLPMTPGAQANAWRDIKVYQDHAFIVADGSLQHGMQVFDLTRLRNVRSAQKFSADVTYDRIASAHNIVIDTTAGFAFAVGSNGGGETCGGALHMVDIREPKNPKFAGCFADPSTGNQRTGYTHDAQCLVYDGPDTSYTGRHICFNSSENALGIADVTDKANPKPLSKASYPNVGYTHQGWITDDRRYFYVDDEGDEIQGTVPGTRTLIWDVSDLDDPVLAGQYISSNRASDHNLYVKGNLMFQSNYSSGLRILDISDPKNPKPVGNFDTNPVGVDVPGFTGSWSNYPYFKSGTIVVTSIQEGLFLVRPAGRPLIP
ncbi:MAG TPA: choice-of-anchor B family protein [Gemmatimonadales bacterium]